MNRRFVGLLGLAATTIAFVAYVTPAAGLTLGYKAIASSAASGVAAGHTGYGPGWIPLTFDTSGQPHGPITGYLFHDGVAQAAGNDHFDVSSYYTQPAASVHTPFAGGYAYGHFNGCALSYLDSLGFELAAEGANQTGGCTPPNHTTMIFCYDQAADPLCNGATPATSSRPASGRRSPTTRRRSRPVAAMSSATSARRRSTTAGRPHRRTSSATS